MCVYAKELFLKDTRGLDSMSGCNAVPQVVADLQLSRLAASPGQGEGKSPEGNGRRDSAGSPFAVLSAQRPVMASKNSDGAEKLLPRTASTDE